MPPTESGRRYLAPRKRRLSPEQEREIAALAGCESLRSLAERFAVSHETVRSVLHRVLVEHEHATLPSPV